MAQHNIRPELLPFAVPIDDLVEYGGNPRQGDLQILARSLRANGQYKPVTLAADGRTIVSGNHTWHAARLLGWDLIAATADSAAVDEAARRRRVLAANRYADLATYDLPALESLVDPFRGDDVEGIEIAEALLDGLVPDDGLAPPGRRSGGSTDGWVKMWCGRHYWWIDSASFAEWFDPWVDEADGDVDTAWAEIRSALCIPPEAEAGGRRRRGNAEPGSGAIGIEDFPCVPIDSIRAHPDNAREGDVGGLAESLAANGQFIPIVVDADRGEILVGNHTWAAACWLGWDDIAAVMLEGLTAKEARRILLVDNLTSDAGTYDPDVLAGELRAAVDDLDGTGYDGDDLDALLRKVEHPDAPGKAKPTTRFEWSDRKLARVERDDYWTWVEDLVAGDGDLTSGVLCRKVALRVGMPQGSTFVEGRRPPLSDPI